MDTTIGAPLTEALDAQPRTAEADDRPIPDAFISPTVPFSCFARDMQPQSPLRTRISAATRRPEAECLAPLLDRATLPPPAADRARALARSLVETLRARGPRGTVEGLVREYALSSDEGVALMCLAEALLRIPDTATRDALIRDKIGRGDWRAHLGRGGSLFVNAATWGLVVTGALTATHDEQGLARALTRLVARGGEPLIRRGVDLAMRMLGRQFVTGETIADALANSRTWQARGFRYSYDMLGEAAMTAADADRYGRSYADAIEAIGRAATGGSVHDRPGISVKLSALHPRYARAQRGRVMRELLPRLRALVLAARAHDIGLNIDAEESDRLDLSLDLLEALCLDPALAGWHGIGFVVQAYQKRAPFVIDWLVELGRRSGHRLMVRLVKGAYWDSEIKRAQVDGLDGFPVYTRKTHTDVSYLACARALLAAPDAVFPQFATHNAGTLAAILGMAGDRFHPGQYEFQCLHGMGEPLYEAVVGPDKLDRPCRIYAPVGTHETLLAYLVRRLLENGANTSFVNRVNDPAVPVEALLADPVAQVRDADPPGAPHPGIALPRALFGAARANAAGLDLANEAVLAALSPALSAGADRTWRAAPMLAGGTDAAGPTQPATNPADRRDRVGLVTVATPDAVRAAIGHAAASAWGATPPAERAACLARAADRLEAEMPALLGLIVREAGKSIGNAVAEVREAVDFLRFYAAGLARTCDGTHRPLGPVACISPWNFPLAIFVGQVAAALAAGNPVLAKPAEETPLIAAQAVRLLREAGVPADAVQLLPGEGEVGAALVADPRVAGVMFTGSTAVARSIQRVLAGRLGADGHPVPLVAETGGQNALVVDSSALPEQVVADVIASAFDSAGQRCSALRVLLLQEDVADRVLAMLRGAMAELSVGNPDRLATDIGPVITPAAQATLLSHIEAMRAAGCAVHAAPLPPDCAPDSFVAPTLIELRHLSQLRDEVFGPVLHVLRWRRGELDGLVEAVNATGYALTFGVHTRLDAVAAQLAARSAAGNVYVNRGLVGAVVGSQPFGGHGLSGTGPKAGGPLILRRLSAACPPLAELTGPEDPDALAWCDWLHATGRAEIAATCRAMAAASPCGARRELPGPVGERNTYRLEPRGAVSCHADTDDALLLQVGAALATGNRAIVPPASPPLRDLPPALRSRVLAGEDGDVALFSGDDAALLRLCRTLADRPGPIVAVHRVGRTGHSYPLEWLVRERAVSTNTTAAGGNAHLLTLG